MESCSRQCIRRTLYAVMIGTSPIVLCLLLVAAARLILHQLETAYYRRQKFSDRHHRSSSMFYYTGRPTLSYTPVSTTELQRIIQGKQLSESSSTIPKLDTDSPKAASFMRSILTRREPSPILSSSSSSNILANLVIRRNAISSTPMTALFAPVSTPVTPTFGIINERRTSRTNALTIQHQSIETTTLGTSNIKNSNDFFETSNSFDGELIESEPLLQSSPPTMTSTTTTTTVVLEEFLDFHSVGSLPYSSLNTVS